MLPPKHVYSAIVKNESDKEVIVTAVYEVPAEGNKATTESVKINVAAGSEGRFEEKIVTFGGAAYISNITSLAVDGGASVAGPFVVSPVRDFVFTVKGDLTIVF